MSTVVRVALLLGRRVRDRREASRRTQAEMARLAGIPRATWAHVESGRANPTLDTLLRVARTLDLGLDELVG